MSVVVFDYAAWAAKYPQFAAVTQPVAQGYFDQATFLLNNTDSSVVTDVDKRAILFGVLVAHFAYVFSGENGNPPSPLVGRVSSASEGSVSIGADAGPVSGTKMWYMQSKYGAMYWQMTDQYRRMQYVAAPTHRQPFGTYSYGYGR